MIESGPPRLPRSSAETSVGVWGSVGRGQGRKERSMLLQRTAALSSTGAPQHNLHTTELTHAGEPSMTSTHCSSASTCSPHAFCLLQLVLQHFLRLGESSVAQLTFAMLLSDSNHLCYLLTLMSFQTWRKEISFVYTTEVSIFFWVLQKIKSHTGLERHEGESMVTGRGVTRHLSHETRHETFRNVFFFILNDEIYREK